MGQQKRKDDKSFLFYFTDFNSVCQVPSLCDTVRQGILTAQQKINLFHLFFYGISQSFFKNGIA
jgi:hypothetical protein